VRLLLHATARDIWLDGAVHVFVQLAVVVGRFAVVGIGAVAVGGTAVAVVQLHWCRLLNLDRPPSLDRVMLKAKILQLYWCLPKLRRARKRRAVMNLAASSQKQTSKLTKVPEMSLGTVQEIWNRQGGGADGDVGHVVVGCAAAMSLGADGIVDAGSTSIGGVAHMCHPEFVSADFKVKV